MKGKEIFSGLKKAAASPLRSSRPRYAFDTPCRALAIHPQRSSTFSTCTANRAEVTKNEGESSSIAAPPIKFSNDGKTDKSALRKLRVVPASPSYFGGMPVFTDSLLHLQSLLRKYQTLPVLPPGQAPRVAWKSIIDLRSEYGEPIKAGRYHKILQVLQRLNYIHPSLMPEEVTLALKNYKRDVNPYDNRAKPGVVDEWGRAKGVGRRKTSSAVAWIVEGEGEVLINGKTLTQAFGRLHDRESAVWALKATQRMDKYNVWALVKGGGVTGQAEAITLAVAKALLVHEPLLKPVLRRAGCVTRDPRKVERKKPGHVKARKMPTWVKR